MKLAAGILFVAALFLPSYSKWEETGDNMFTIYLNGENVGVVGEEAQAEELLQAARRELVSGSDELVFMDVDMNLESAAVLWGKVDDAREIKARMRTVLAANIKETMQRSYVIKVNDYMANLASREEVGEFDVLTAVITDTSKEEAKEPAVGSIPEIKGGVEAAFNEALTDVEPAGEKDFGDYELGLVNMSFAEEVEIVEAYLDVTQLTPLAQVIEEVIKEQEVNAVYEVVAGDTLSEISIKVNIPMDQIVAMNDALENENTTIRVGQELIITIPEPELSVDRQEARYYDEIYDAEVQYVDRDDWYTTQTRTIQEPHAGYRRVVAIISYRNDKETGREILKEELVMAAVPKIVERGTIVPPTYVKPISGGRLSSGFGRRNAPKKGASSYHKGVDWAVSTGTAVVASCGGTVVKAGWSSGYGYCVYINHPDGRQTRYAHLSKVLVSVGQNVSQGQRIALSGNTGVSTGPHLHFEMLINGTQVNPLNYF